MHSQHEPLYSAAGVWLQAAACRGGCPADSSDSAAGAAGAASTPFFHWRRPDHCLLLTPGPAHWWACSTNTYNVTKLTQRRGGPNTPHARCASRSPQSHGTWTDIGPTVSGCALRTPPALSRHPQGSGAERAWPPTISWHEPRTASCAR